MLTFSVAVDVTAHCRETVDQRPWAAVGRQDVFDPAAVFGRMAAAFDDAIERDPDGLCESFYTLAGRSVRFRIVGRELAEHLVRPFSHLRVHGPVPPQLTIDLWDENETDIRCQANPADDPAWMERTVMSADSRFMGQRLPHTLSCLDRQGQRLIGSVAWHDRIFIYERAKPLARPLLQWHNDQGVQVIHTALLSRDGQGVLLAGKSGSGKSTTALIGVCGGLDYLSEDYVGLQHLDDGSFVGHSLYNSVFLETPHITQFTTLGPFVIRGRPPHEEKSVVILSQVFPERLRRTALIRALALPRVLKASDAARSRIRPASKGEALLALGPSSLLQIPSLGRRGFDTLVRLAERVPCYWLEIGRDMGEIPARLDELLAESVGR